MEEAERPRVRGGRGNEGRGEGFITKDLLLLPGGGEALERRAALHTCVGWCVYPMHRPLYIYICVCSQNIHGRVHVTWISWIRKLDVPRLLATAVCPTSALCRVSMHYALRN